MSENQENSQATDANRSRRYWLLILLGAVVVILFIPLVYFSNWQWASPDDWKGITLWDWLDLLLIPLLLGAAGAYWNFITNLRREREEKALRDQQAREDKIRQERQKFESLEARRRDEERYREETVRKYFDDIAYLMVGKGLLGSVQSVEYKRSKRGNETTESMTAGNKLLKLANLLENPVWHMAQTRTITVLRRMAYQRIVDNNDSSSEKLESIIDVQRVNEILDFLRDSGLLRGAGSVLLRANFRNATLKGVDLKLANLLSADLYQANLSGASLHEANLSKTHLADANLSNSDLIRANLSEAKLFGTNLCNANLHGANLSSTELRKAILSGATLDDANLSGANLFRVDLTDLDLFSVDFSGADLRYVDFSGANLIDANFSGANLRNATFDSKTVLPDARLIRQDDDGKQIYDKYFDTNLGLEQMERYINPKSVKQQANNNDEDT
ncbi:MAG: pentapeptide repeat-containing protein [Anaerolineae bacterium]|nr:pentapeptide repeat-containing protein [Anaerolineae bacterium]